jgi:hypothetical protein
MSGATVGVNRLGDGDLDPFFKRQADEYVDRGLLFCLRWPLVLPRVPRPVKERHRLPIPRASAGGALSKVPHDRKAGSHPGNGLSIIALSSKSLNVLRCCARVRAFGARCHWSSSLFGCR